MARESMKDALERLVYRTEMLLGRLEKEHVTVPLWNAMALESALDLARMHLVSLNEDKEAVLDKVRETWYDYPQLRFMQLLENVGGPGDCCMYYMRDEDLKERLEETYD